jgi:hypothetical protein
MKVKTLAPHDNSYPPEYHKRVGRVYEIPDDTAAQTLIDAKLVEKHADERQSSRVSRAGSGAGGAA